MAQINDSQEQVTINVETLQPVTRTLMTIGALPTSYLISMTYEEQLLWLQNYLIKTVIPAINNNAEATQEVQDIVMALQQYINDYFNNLDVQDEINNKLDDLVEDGTLTRLIGEYVQPLIDEQNEDIQDFENSVRSEINSFDDRLRAVASGSPAGVYSDLTTLRSQNPDHSKIYITADNGNWNYYNQAQQQFVSGGPYQAGINTDTVSELINFIGKTTYNLYDKRDMSWFQSGYDSIPFVLKAGKYLISLVSTGTDQTFTINFRSGNTNVANKVLNNADFNTRNSTVIELTGDSDTFRIWNDVPCEIKDIMITPFDFGELDYVKSVLTNTEIIEIINNNFDYFDNTLIKKMETEMGELIDLTELAVSEGDYGYKSSKKYNTTSLYSSGGAGNKHKTYDVSFNEHFIIDMVNVNNGAMAPILFTDDDLNVIDGIYLSTGMATQQQEYEFKIPMYATKLLVSYRGGASNPISIKKYKYKTLENVINEIVIDKKNDIPEYYREHLKSKINEIHDNEMEIGANGDTVAFITDTHVANNSMNSPYLLKDLYDKTNLHMVIDGGDIVTVSKTETDTKERAIGNIYKSLNTFNPLLDNRIIRCFGNHDDNGYGAYYEGQERLSLDEVFGSMFKRQFDLPKVVYDENNPNGFYCYYENTENKIRYILLNTDEKGDRKGFSVDCANWLVNKALVFPNAGWSVAFFTHQPIKDNGNYYKYREMFKALNNGTTFNWEGTYDTAVYNIHADFTGDKQADVLFVACGHNHEDRIGIDNNVVYFKTTCDAHYNDDEELGYRRTPGTIYEQAFDVICINKTTKHVKLVRVGAGNNREFIYGANPEILT